MTRPAGTAPVEPDTRTRDGDAARGAATAGSDTARGSDTVRGGMGSGVGTAPGEAGGVGRPGGLGGLDGETAAGRDSAPGRAGSPGPAVTRDQADAHGDRTGTHGEPGGTRGREAHDGSGALGASEAGAGAGAGGHGSGLLPRDECDKLSSNSSTPSPGSWTGRGTPRRRSRPCTGGGGRSPHRGRDPAAPYASAGPGSPRTASTRALPRRAPTPSNSDWPCGTTASWLTGCCVSDAGTAPITSDVPDHIRRTAPYGSVMRSCREPIRHRHQPQRLA
ncbi:hypothetical protein SALBM311S_04308 [Streptomyces alboniger]